jgi:Cysteine-rich CWC
MELGKSSAPRRLLCARCGTASGCTLGVDCWCHAEPFRLPMPETGSADDDCLCPACLQATARQTNLAC